MPTRLTESEKAEAFEDALWLLEGGVHPSRVLSQINNRLTLGQIQIRLATIGKTRLASAVLAEMEFAKKKRESNV